MARRLLEARSDAGRVAEDEIKASEKHRLELINRGGRITTFSSKSST